MSPFRGKLFSSAKAFRDAEHEEEMTMTVASSHLHTVADSDGATILDVDHGSISTLNSTGSFVWQGLQCGETISTIVTRLARETGEAPATVERDVMDFVESLTKLHLLQPL